MRSSADVSCDVGRGECMRDSARNVCERASNGALSRCGMRASDASVRCQKGRQLSAFLCGAMICDECVATMLQR